jgi:8-oxo-dGTP pyrophosphatase MutT (NUDIX family)/transcriptional regulator with XRE-family HTH domain
MTSIRASDLVAERVKSLRARRGWTIRQLAERCAEIGAPELSVSVIANIETGRRDKDGHRRRDVTIDEVLSLAYALDAPPVLLCMPYNGWDHLRITSRIEAPAVKALDWITGDELPGPFSDVARWMSARLPLTLYRQFRAAVAKVNAWLASHDLETPEGLQLEDSPLTDLADALNAMIGAGVSPPALPETWVRAMRPLLQDPSRVSIEPLPFVTGIVPPDLRVPVVAAIVTSSLGVLVGRRSDGNPPWTFIAGEQDAVKDENPADTATREVKEETGLLVRASHVIGHRIHPKTGRRMIYIAAEPTHGTEIFVNDEAELAEVRWVSLAEADELLPGMFGLVREYLARELGEA